MKAEVHSILNDALDTGMSPIPHLFSTLRKSELKLIQQYIEGLEALIELHKDIRSTQFTLNTNSTYKQHESKTKS